MKTPPKSYEEVKMMQESFWETIHNRGEWKELRFVPNPLAVDLQKIIPARSNILEVGCSSGRDARYFASCGHNVVAMDFSQMALKRMMDHAKQQGIDAQIIPVHKNVAEGLPDLRPDSIDCFYSDFGGINQIQNVIQKLKKNPESKSATITLMNPDGDKHHMPCIVALDFKIRNKQLMLTAFFRSQDVGKKIYADIICLGEIEKQIADSVGVAMGPLNILIVSLHVYEADFEKIADLIA